MKRVLLTGLGAASLVMGGWADRPLCKLYEADFLVGNIMGMRGWPQNYADRSKRPYRFDLDESVLLVREFNCVTAENGMKWSYLQPERGRFNFEQTDRFIDFAEANGLKVVGHPLIWHVQVPSWVFKDAEDQPVSREVLIERMRTYIHTVVGRYKGRIKYWDVVNEAIMTRWVVDESLPLKEDGTPQKKQEAFLRKTPWKNIIGEEYLELAFQFAHEADPDAVLLYNDFTMFNPAKAAFAVTMIEKIRAAGSPVHGVGMQGHWHLGVPSVEQVQQAVDLFAAADLRVHITELDITVLPRKGVAGAADMERTVEIQAMLNPYTNGVPQEVLAQQAQRYHEIFTLFLDNREHIDRVSFWGVSDRDSWRNNFPIKRRTDYPLLFDRNFSPKPAYYALRNAKTAYGQLESKQLDGESGGTNGHTGNGVAEPLQRLDVDKPQAPAGEQDHA